MTMPYSPHQMQSGLVPSMSEYLDPTTAAPVVDCQAAVDVAMAGRGAAADVLSIPNMSDPGTHAGPIGVDTSGPSNTY